MKANNVTIFIVSFMRILFRFCISFVFIIKKLKFEVKYHKFL